MSILIKGMEMPAVCADCDFCIETEDDHKCSRTKESLGLFAFEMTRGMKCPLGYIPKKHGDLIDRNVLYHNMFIGPDEKAFPDRDVDNFPHEMRFEDIKRFIRKAQTVIQASE